MMKVLASIFVVLILFQASVSFCCFRVDKLSSNIETQTEMLEKVVKMLASKDVNTNQLDVSPPVQLPRMSPDHLNQSSIGQSNQLSVDEIDHSPIGPLNL